MTREQRAVEQWARKAREATWRRDLAICQMSGAGASLRDIAALAGVSHATVARIVATGAPAGAYMAAASRDVSALEGDTGR
jgi:lambda repressor-like predicted transcriptional regulator